MRTIRFIILAMGAVLNSTTAAGAAAPTAEDAEWRAQRLAKLTRPDGWLTLIGLHFLAEGANTVGSGADNAVVLARGPARVGTVTVAKDGRVTLEVAVGAPVRVDGADVRSAELQWRPSPVATKVTFGSVTMFVIERGGRKALRVRDSEAARRVRFAGLEYFPLDASWRIAARWVPAAQPQTVAVTNILGQVSSERVAGRAIFERAGRRIELVAIDEGSEAPLFFVISDATSGRSTYGGGRHLYAARPAGDAIVLDFNRAENPPCAFTPYSTCPVPPPENRLPFAVTAGEKAYRDEIE
jgi:uncharacterized protein (DUF1684 family)